MNEKKLAQIAQLAQVQGLLQGPEMQQQQMAQQGQKQNLAVLLELLGMAQAQQASKDKMSLDREELALSERGMTAQQEMSRSKNMLDLLALIQSQTQVGGDPTIIEDSVRGMPGFEGYGKAVELGKQRKRAQAVANLTKELAIAKDKPALLPGLRSKTADESIWEEAATAVGINPQQELPKENPREKIKEALKAHGKVAGMLYGAKL